MPSTEQANEAVDSSVTAHPSEGGAAAESSSARDSSSVHKEWTFAYYLAAETSDNFLGMFDVNALERRYAELAPFMNIVVLVDGYFGDPEIGWPDGTSLLEIRADDSGRIVSEIVPPADTAIAQLLKVNNGELRLATPEVLKAFLDFVQSRYPSTYFALDVLDHGEAWNGAVYDFSEDVESFTMVGPMPLAQFQSVFSSLARPIDLLAFDACLMQNVTANTWWHLSAPNVKYVLGSEQNNVGWNLDRVFGQFAGLRSRLGTLSPQALATAFVGQTNGGDWNNNVTESVVDLAQWPSVVGRLDDLGAALLAAGGMSNPTIRSVVNERVTRLYGQTIGATTTHEDLVDTVELCDLLESAFGSATPVAQAASALRRAVQQAVVANSARRAEGDTSERSAADVSHGINLHLPRTETPAALGAEAFERNNGPALSLFPNWLAFLRTI